MAEIRLRGIEWKNRSASRWSHSRERNVLGNGYQEDIDRAWIYTVQPRVSLFLPEQSVRIAMFRPPTYSAWNNSLERKRTRCEKGTVLGNTSDTNSPAVSRTDSIGFRGKIRIPRSITSE